MRIARCVTSVLSVGGACLPRLPNLALHTFASIRFASTREEKAFHVSIKLELFDDF